MKKTTLLKQYISDPEILVMPGAHDALTAKIIEKAGFKVLTMGGYSASASLLGMPDLSLLTLSEMTECYRRVANAVNIPVFVDGDTGHGGVFNVARTVREIEATNAAGMFIEDQVHPKRCGHMKGKQVIPTQEMIAKLKAALDARIDPDFVLMARTDALAVNGLDDAIERMTLYREVGVDLLFIEAPKSVDQMRRICTELNGPCLANMIEGGVSPNLSDKELEDIGYAVVAHPVAATYAVAQAATDLMETFFKEGSTEGFGDRMMSFHQFNSLVGLNDLRAWEHKLAGFASELLAKTRKES